MKKIVVFGSINVDIFNLENEENNKKIFICPNSKKIKTIILPGGKGANQAAVTAWLGAKTYMIGCLGNDEMGLWLLNVLKSQNVDISRIKLSAKNPTPIITIQKNEKYSFLVSAGTNIEITKKIVDDNIDLIKEADLVLTQLEIPFDVVNYLADVCIKYNKKIILNPDPKIPFNKQFFQKFNYITPNEKEMEIEDIKWIVNNTKSTVVQTSGKHGAIWYQKGNVQKKYKAKKYKLVSSIGAGDTFSGTFAYYIVNGFSIDQAIKKAIENSSWSIRQLGIQKLPKK